MSHALANCPRCGRQPRLVEREFMMSPGEDSRYRFGVECRRWLGLRVCMLGPDAWIFKDWADVGVREAARKWNEMVSKEWAPRR